MDYELFKNRYLQLLETKQLSERELMRQAKLPRDKIRAFLIRGRLPSDYVAICKISQILEINPFYLLEPLGLTPMLLDSPVDTSLPVYVAHEPREARLIETFRKLDQSQQDLMLKLFEAALATRRDIPAFSENEERIDTVEKLA